MKSRFELALEALGILPLASAPASIPAPAPLPESIRIGGPFQKWNGKAFVRCELNEIKRGHIFRREQEPHIEYRATADAREKDGITVLLCDVFAERGEWELHEEVPYSSGTFVKSACS